MVSSTFGSFGVFIRNILGLIPYFSLLPCSSIISKHSCAFLANPFSSLFQHVTLQSVAKYWLPYKVLRAWLFQLFLSPFSVFCRS